MKEQWKEFIDDNYNLWSYGIVPELIERLDMAIDNCDGATVIDILNRLLLQGIIINQEGDLCFAYKSLNW
jgi:ATP-dependent protease Clp ATPase subunit